MQLPRSKARQNYTDQIKIIEANLRDATHDKKDKALLAHIQKRIDSVAEKYQYDEEIGTARYKLYELQAVVHYFNEHDDDALDFINQAIEMRGETYAKAEKIKKQLSLGDSHLKKTIDPEKMTKEQRREQKIGLEGWLALFVVGVMISVVLYLVAGGLWLHNLDTVHTAADNFAANALSPYYAFLMLTSFGMALAAAWLLFLLFKRKRIARWVGITFLVASILVSLLDYMWYASLMTEISGLDPQKGNAGTAWSLVWIVYLCVSKRVKRTLTK